jgi:membrane fusion protein, copper/silver efflux system
MNDWVKPLPKHHGQHGGLIAVGLLVTAGIVVWGTQPGTPIQVASEAPATIHAPPASALPAATIEPTATKLVATPLPTRVIANGFVSFDERRTMHVGVPVAGLLEKARASSLGRRIRQGETLGTIYSPEVYLTSVNLIADLRTFRSQEAVDRGRFQLLRWGMPRPVLAGIEHNTKPALALPLVARTSGIVVAEQGAQRTMIDPSSGLELFTITEPAYTWVLVELADADAVRTRVGTPAKLTVEGIARPIAAKVAYIYRRSEDGMRTVRFEIHSPRVILKPSARVTAELELPR